MVNEERELGFKIVEVSLLRVVFLIRVLCMCVLRVSVYFTRVHERVRECVYLRVYHTILYGTIHIPYVAYVY